MTDGEKFSTYTRREFLKGAALLATGAVLESCRPKGSSPITPTKSAENPTKTPTAEPTVSPTVEPTPLPTAEQAPTEEVKTVAGITITERYLKEALSGIGDGGDVEIGNESAVSFGEKYVGEAWGEEIDFKNLPKDAMASLKYILSLGSYIGKEGIVCLGGDKGKEIFPRLADFNVLRLPLGIIASEAEQKNQPYKEWVFPHDLLIRPGTQMTVIGYLAEKPLGEGVGVIDGGEEGQRKAVAAITDYNRASENGIPRHYLVILPDRFPADPNNIEAPSLANILAANGCRYDHVSKSITYPDPNGDGQTVWTLNNVDAGVSELAKQEAGFYFVDQIDGQLINNPIVPFYENQPAVWDAKEENGIIKLYGGDSAQSELPLVAEARYDFGTNQWRWEKVNSAEEQAAGAPKIEGLKATVGEDGIVTYWAEENNPYGLEAGKYAGYVFDYILVEKNADGEEAEVLAKGVALGTEVRKKLLEEANTPEAIERDEWQTTFPFDPQGERIRIWPNLYKSTHEVAISGLLSDTEFRSPFIEEVYVRYYLDNKLPSVLLTLSEKILPDSQKGINYGFSFYFTPTVLENKNNGLVGLDDLLFTNIGESLTDQSFPKGSQVLITGASLEGSKDVHLSRFLRVDNAFVFGLREG